VGGGSHGVTDSLLVAKMNSRQSFENSHHSNPEPDPAFGGSQRRLKRAQQSALLTHCLALCGNVCCASRRAARLCQEDGHPERTAAKLSAIASCGPETVHHGIFLFINTMLQTCLPGCGNLANLSVLEIITK